MLRDLLASYEASLSGPFLKHVTLRQRTVVKLESPLVSCSADA